MMRMMRSTANLNPSPVPFSYHSPTEIHFPLETRAPSPNTPNNDDDDDDDDDDNDDDDDDDDDDGENIVQEDEKWWWVCCLEFCFCLL